MTQPPDEFLSFMDVYARLPGGGLQGQDTPVFGRPERPERFVAPSFAIRVGADEPAMTLISARGATGKTHLAKVIAAMKSAPLWQLGADRSVSGDAVAARLNGFLGNNGVRRFKQDGDALMVIDALDEARLRVSGTSWAEFVQSLIDLNGGQHRLVLLGRERVVEDVWVSFDDAGTSCQWFEIQHFDEQQRAQYVDVNAARLGASTDSEVYQRAREAVLVALAGTVEAGLSDAFVGYAPVLDAVAALLGQGNPLTVINRFEGAAMDAESRIAVLSKIVRDLEAREQSKVATSVRELGLPEEIAYSPGEQDAWLAAELMGGTPPDLEWCPPEQRAEYSDRLRGFLSDHPFRSEDRWASPVFSAFVAAQTFSDRHIRRHLQAVARSTGLLYDFVTDREEPLIDEWQFAALHASMLAAEWRELEATVSIEALHTDEEVDSVNGELLLVQEGATKPRRTDFEIALERSRELSLLGPTAYLTVDFPGRIRVVTAGGLVLGPECFIRCEQLVLEADSVEVARRVDRPGTEPSDEPSVTLEATEELRTDAPLVGSPAPGSLEVRVPYALPYPWHDHGAPLTPTASVADERAKRLLNMLMRLLRRHGHRGRQAVFDKKLEGRQSIKGEDFQAAIGALEAAGAISHEGDLIFLQPDWETHWFSGRAQPGQPCLEDKWDVWGGPCQQIAERLG